MSIIEKNDIMTMKELADYLKIAEKQHIVLRLIKRFPDLRLVMLGDLEKVKLIIG